jgi:hypothetical protein
MPSIPRVLQEANTCRSRPHGTVERNDAQWISAIWGLVGIGIPDTAVPTQAIGTHPGERTPMNYIIDFHQ